MTKRIPLNHGKFALVDDEDYEAMARHNWSVSTNPSGTDYAVRNAKGDHGRRSIYMHREIAGAHRGQCVDHINGNGLDNRRANLRLCVHRENIWNQKPRRTMNGVPVTSLYKGVYWNKRGLRWMARIRVAGHLSYLGLFTSEHDAARAYNAAALEHFGEFARPNVIPEAQEATMARRLWPENGESEVIATQEAAS